MNNQITTVELLRETEAKTIRIVEALQGTQKTKEWRTLKEEIFDGFASSLEREIKSEARSENPNPQKLNRLSGKLEWAERFSDLAKLEDYYKIQLKNLKIKLYEKE